jgi:hypothetical protein
MDDAMTEPDENRGEDAEALVLLVVKLNEILPLFDAEKHGGIEIVVSLTVAQARGAYREMLRLLMGEGPYSDPPFELHLVPDEP